jgi:hypothetical protein
MSYQVCSSHTESKSFVAYFNNKGYYKLIRTMWLTTQKFRKNHLKSEPVVGKTSKTN